MKYVNLVFCAVMILFAAAQYNDPDALLWSVIYLIPAAWAAVAAFRPQALRKGLPMVLLGLTAVVTVALTVYYWPTTPGFWNKDVWWNTETAREGMGMMVVMATVAVALLTVLLRGGRPSS